MEIFATEGSKTHEIGKELLSQSHRGTEEEFLDRMKRIYRIRKRGQECGHAPEFNIGTPTPEIGHLQIRWTDIFSGGRLNRPFSWVGGSRSVKGIRERVAVKCVFHGLQPLKGP